METFVGRFSDRLGSLERTQEVLGRDPEDRAHLGDLVTAELAAQGGTRNGRVLLEGEPGRLGWLAAHALVIVVHELSTKGRESGVLAQSGNLHVSWAPSADGQRLVFTWHETAVPSGLHRLEGGSGSQLIREIVLRMPGGTSSLDATEDGMRRIIELPTVESGGRRFAGGALTNRRGTRLRRDLVVDDEAGAPMTLGHGVEQPGSAVER